LEENMNDKQQVLGKLNEVFRDWEEFLAGLTEEQITNPNLPANWSIKDVVAHLWGWQQVTLARAEAAVNDEEPKYPDWPETSWADPEADVDQTNAWIYETNRDKPWASVYAEWKTQFQRLFVLWDQIPEKDLFQEGRYTWMEEYPLSESLLGTYEHHAEHLEELLPRPAEAEQSTG